MRASALALASLGFAVFPLAHDGRTPLVKGGVHSASRDPSQIEAWWSQWPDANIGLACGPTSGVLALDIDRKGGKDGYADLLELEAEFGPLPATVGSRTPSGGGHRLFAHPLGLKVPNRVGLKRYGSDGARRVYAGLDTRAEGGFICVPPSMKGGLKYSWLSSPFNTPLAPTPIWLLDLMISQPPPRPLRQPPATFDALRSASYVAAAINGECSELATMPPNSGRNVRLFKAAARLGELIAAGTVTQALVESALEQAATACGLIADDGLRSVRGTISSGFRHGAQNPRRIP